MEKATVRSVTQLSVPVEDAPGMLAKVARVFASGGVTVKGICRTTAAFGNAVTERFVVDNVELGKRALESIGKRYTEEEIISVRSPGYQSAVLAEITTAIGGAGISLKNFYYSCVEQGREAVMYVEVDPKNLQKAIETIQNI